MSDSFADLWNSSAPAQSKPPPQKLGAAQAGGSGMGMGSGVGMGAKRPQYDAFSILSSAPSSRPITPSTKPTPPPQPRQQGNSTLASAGGGDAFSSLLTGTMAANNQANLTIAQRAALAEKKKTEEYLKRVEKQRMEGAQWSGIDSLGASATASPALGGKIEDEWFGSGSGSGSPAPPAVKPKTVVEDDWGLSDFATAPPSKPTTTANKPPAPAQSGSSGSLWDLDEFTSPSSSTNSKPAAAPKTNIRQPTPNRGEFDFDALEREDGLLGNGGANGARDDGWGMGGDDAEDILGDLSKPVDAIPKRRSPARDETHSHSPSPPPQLPTRSRPQRQAASSSPPPHIIGQIVEMGFSPQQARTALAKTEGGVDVQAALESLLGGEGSARPSPQPEERELERDRPRPAPRRNTNTREQTRDTSSPSHAQGQSPQQLQDQADKLLAQASEIGLNMFNKGFSLWNQGKEKAQKMYEERQAAQAAAGGSGGGRGSGKGTPDGRPRWMQDGVHDEDGEEVAQGAGKGVNGKGRERGGFTDDHSREARAGPSRPPPQPKPQAPKTADLFSDSPGEASPSTYKSPFRRGKPTPQSTPKPTPPRAPSPLKQRPTIAAPSSSIASSAQHKAAGTEKYKLGQFGEAEQAYGAAIQALPDGHLLLVPLLNNRALARSKTGNGVGAVEDCTTVITLISGPAGVNGYNPSREAPEKRTDHGAGVDLGDGLVKALKRRAEAWEGREKWEEARKDWETLAGVGWAGAAVRGEAVRGVGRCKRMAEANSSAAEAPKPKPKPTPKPPPKRPAANTAPSAALTALRTQNNALEAEDDLRHKLKDSVDARLLAWKGGKETNIRALIASLENVLWDELGWVKVGMSELVMEKQVKIRYTKAIAKVHPDKLNANNTTLEQRMIANGVFGALNDAWNAFKQ